MEKKPLNLAMLISIVVGNMVGTGIYVLPASLAQYGTISIISWIYTSLGALFLALTFANLNKRIPKTGGPYIFCREAFGKPIGFTIAYTYWISNLACISGIAVASIGYLGFITPILNGNSSAYDPYLALTLEIGAVWLFTIINIIGLHTAGVVQLILTIIKVSPLLLITLIGFGSIHFSNLSQFTVGNESHFTAISNAAALTFWAFIGLESATVPAENTNGSSDIYKATLFGPIIASLIYILSTIVLMGMIPIAHLKSSQFPFAEAATMLFGSNSASIIAICAVISGLGALNVCILVQGQIVFAAARDHLFPRAFANLSQNKVPVAGHILSSSLITIFLILTVEPSLLAQFNNIILLAALLTLTTYLVTTLSQLKFLWEEKRSLTQLLLSKTTFISLLAAAYTIWMITSLNTKIIWIGFTLIFFCIPIYFFIIRKYALNPS